MRIALKQAVTVAAVTFVAGVPSGHAQSLSDLIDRAKSEVQRAATQALTQRPAPAASSSSSTPATTPIPTPAPSTAPAPTAAATPANPTTAAEVMRKLPAWTQKQATDMRTLDFRNGVPESLKGRGFWPGTYVQLANPYAPADRIAMLEAKAMACHPEGGVVIWAQMIRQDISKPIIDLPNTDTGVGAYRVDAEGRVTPYAARDERERRSGKKICDTTLDQWFLPDWGNFQRMLVEPGGDLLLASGWHQAVMRVKRDGRIERVAGGGEGLCNAYVYDGGETGYRDGPAAQALFKGTMALARANDGTIYVAEGNFLPGGGSWNAGNCSIRRIGTDGIVSTVYGNGQCEKDSATYRRAATTSVGLDRIAIDRGGQFVVVGSARGPYNGGADGIFTKAHRVDPATGRSQLLAFGAVAAGTPQGRFDGALGIAPDGTPVAFDDPSINSSSSHAGLVALDGPRPALRYWWKSRPGVTWIDGPDSGVSDVLDFCTATDGTMYFLQKNALRRLDPKSGQVTTWLH